MSAPDRWGLVEEAARIVCVEQMIDYRAAKRRALERLGLPQQTPLPDNAAVHAAVIDYQRLFGGERYRQQLRRMRLTAERAMKLLQAFDPRVVGATLSGAVTEAHRVQLHVFADAAEDVDIDLMNRRIPFDPDERSYRYPSGREERVPLLRIEQDGQGVDVAVFAVDDQRRLPINPLDGKAFRRGNLDELRQLIAAGPND